MIKKGAHKFQGQELISDEIMKKFREEAAEELLKDFIDNPIIKVISPQIINTISWVSSEIINKVSNDILSTSLDTLKNVL